LNFMQSIISTQVTQGNKTDSQKGHEISQHIGMLKTSLLQLVQYESK